MDFFKQLVYYDKDNIPRHVMKKLKTYTREESFDPANVRRLSAAAGDIAEWILAIEAYHEHLKGIPPARTSKANP